jgi:uncharacterized membrane protein (DUF4010 family)
MDIINNIPDVLVQFIIVLLLSLLIGLEQRSYHDEDEGERALFGTDRTFTLIGLFGFLLYILDQKNFTLFITGAFILAVLFGVFYYWKVKNFRSYGITNILVALATYCLGPIVVTQPRWLTILVVVAILIMVPLKQFFQNLTKKFEETEFITIAKFLIIAGVILPIIPRTAEIPFINISAYDLWLTVVVVSSISYLSYLLQKFVFKQSGIIISGILGGFYSSTATTLILSRKSKENKTSSNLYAASIVFATAMMYVRVVILMFIFNNALGMFLFPYFIIMILCSLATGAVIHYINKPKDGTIDYIVQDKNPLELKIAALFAILFVLFSFITHFTIQHYGTEGLDILSYIVGFTDIDPFLLNLFQGKYEIAMNFIAKASLQAIISNNILKTLFTVFLADSHTKKVTLAGMGIITLINLILVFLI